MAKEYIVLKNGKYIVDRLDSKQDAEDRALELLNESPGASFESGKLDKRVWYTTTDPDPIFNEEVY